MKTRLPFLLIVMMLSCSNSLNVNDGGWEVVQAKGVNPENKLFYFLSFTSKGYGLVLGSSFSDENILRKEFNSFKAIYYFSNDNGLNWIEKDLGLGKFTSYVAKDNYVLVSKEQKGKEIKLTATSLYISSDFGKSFKECSFFNDFFIRNIFILSESELFIIGKQPGSRNWTISGSIDGGKKWNNIGSVENDLQSPIIINREVFYLTKLNGKNLLKRVSLESGIVSEIALPKQLKTAYFLAVGENSIFIVGQSGHHIYIYKSCKSQLCQFSEMQATEKFPVGIEIINNRIHLLMGERNSIRVTYSLYSKTGGSKNWDVISVPSSYFKPFTFSKSEIWGYSFDGKFYKKKLY